MQTIDIRPLVVSDLSFWVNKIILYGGQEITGPAAAYLKLRKIGGFIKGDAFTMLAQFLHNDGSPLDLRDILDGGPWYVERVCYNVCHMETRKISPIFDHSFTRAMEPIRGCPQVIGRMKLYPAEDVWPEICRLGWSGKLPQFYQ